MYRVVAGSRQVHHVNFGCIMQGLTYSSVLDSLFLKLFSCCNSGDLVLVAPGAPPLLTVIGTCRWTGYDFAGHQYWHRVSNRPNVVITIDTGYQIGLMWSSPLTQGIKIGLLGYGGLLVYHRITCPSCFMTDPRSGRRRGPFFFCFFFCLSAQHPQSEVCNIATGYAFECF